MIPLNYPLESQDERKEPLEVTCSENENSIRVSNSVGTPRLAGSPRHEDMSAFGCVSDDMEHVELSVTSLSDVLSEGAEEVSNSPSTLTSR